ncbi:hypothetical protein [Rhodoplanes roseus]|uniref:Uncharacterized protein n=1 Tax=Rhodoplanes roseus TaxID=29409 RepID=A0A327KBC4_9BRAD|nr:hypothetical protein [Rhodoplanes roseus]RAI35256.1 hypothetical protein CH341_30990 [Rhodoplanes roseus]
MANASRKNMGVGAQGKGDGTGANTEVDKDILPDNMVLSNRDKARHPEERGLDGKFIQTEQFQDHSTDRLSEE